MSKGTIWLFKRINLFQKESFEKIHETPQLFVNSICRKVEILVFESVSSKNQLRISFFQMAKKYMNTDSADVLYTKITSLYRGGAVPAKTV